MNVITFIALLVSTSFCQCRNTTNSNDVISTEGCPKFRNPDVTLGGQHCCNSTYRTFRIHYNNRFYQLTSFLEKLRAWNCPQFEEECENRYFQFNRFTALVYDRFCNETAFNETCRDELNDIDFIYNATQRDGEISNETLYSDIIFSSPCLQVKAYEYGRFYVEIVRPLFAFCGSIWCGYNEFTLAFHKPSVWLCIPSSCRAGIVIVIVVCSILAVAVTIANLTVIIVISRNPRCPTSQMVYKLSLAAADLLVGVFVYPTFAYTLYAIQVGLLVRRTLDDDPELSNSSFNSSLLNSYGKPDPSTSNYYLSILDPAYEDAFGILTAVSLMVSVFTLMFASYDRFQAINKPLRYDKEKAKTNAQRITIILWAVAIVIGILPILAPELGGYRILAGGVFIAVWEETSLILHSIALGVPLLAVWILTLLLNIIVKRQADIRKKLVSSARQNRDSRLERRLTKTLSIMVGVFTACILPALIIVIIPFVVPSIDAPNITILAKEPARAFISLELAVIIILASNSLWNCFIYSFRNKEFREDAAAIYFKILSALGLVRVKKLFGSCLFRMAYSGRRRLSTVFTATTRLSDQREKSSTSAAETTSSANENVHETSKTKSKDISATSANSTGLDSYI